VVTSLHRTPFEENTLDFEREHPGGGDVSRLESEVYEHVRLNRSSDDR
jgi:hypothetical protein